MEVCHSVSYNIRWLKANLTLLYDIDLHLSNLYRYFIWHSGLRFTTEPTTYYQMHKYLPKQVHTYDKVNILTMIETYETK